MLLCLITFICVFGTGMILNFFFFIALSEKTNHGDKDLQPQVSSCLPLLTTYHLCIKKRYTEGKSPSEKTVQPERQLE